MKEYIEREAAIDHLIGVTVIKYTPAFSLGMGAAAAEIQGLPAADVVEVRHGRWKFGRGGCGTCSECGRTQSGVWDYDTWQNYCGHCGAKMDKEE